jgi:hypothetical protein
VENLSNMKEAVGNFKAWGQATRRGGYHVMLITPMRGILPFPPSELPGAGSLTNGTSLTPGKIFCVDHQPSTDGQVDH